jgi:hypothetical protein
MDDATSSAQFTIKSGRLKGGTRRHSFYCLYRHNLLTDTRTD